MYLPVHCSHVEPGLHYIAGELFVALLQIQKTSLKIRYIVGFHSYIALNEVSKVVVKHQRNAATSTTATYEYSSADCEC